jgi:glutamate/tyrosine decarboxylase-like PLP-dependent enzyme
MAAVGEGSANLSVTREPDGPASEPASLDPRDPRPARSGRDVGVSMTPEAFRTAGHALVERIAHHLEALPEGRITPGEGPDVVRAALGGEGGLPDAGEDPVAVLERASEMLFGHSLFNGHPKFFGYVSGSPAPLGMLGDLLAAAVNPNVGAWVLAPMASEIEAQTVRWLAELVGYPADCGGLLVSGGNMANFVGFLAARAAAGASFGVREAGLRAPAAAQFTVYASSETHTWIQKATDMFGLGTDAIRWVPTDESMRVDVSALRRAVDLDRDSGLHPMMVVGTAGSVMCGAVDPLPELAAYCREQGIWFHIDGAYGGFAAASPAAPVDLREGLGLADSLAIDPHKWLYAPLEAGCTLVRDAQALRDAFSYHPPYYYFGSEAVNFVDFGMQNSRGFRALKVWLALKQAGRQGYANMITQDILLARRLHESVADHDELEALVQGLSISTFRYVPAEWWEHREAPDVREKLNDLNEAIQARLERAGELFLSNAVIDERYALRACIVNFNTTTRDIDDVADMVVRAGRAVHGERRESA